MAVLQMNVNVMSGDSAQRNQALDLDTLFKPGRDRASKVIFFSTDNGGIFSGDINQPIGMGTDAVNKSILTLRDMFACSCFIKPQYRTNNNGNNGTATTDSNGNITASTGSLTYTISEEQVPNNSGTQDDSLDNYFFNFNSMNNPLKLVSEYIYKRIYEAPAYGIMTTSPGSISIPGYTFSEDVTADVTIFRDTNVIREFESNFVNAIKVVITWGTNSESFLIYFNPDQMVRDFDKLQVYYYADIDDPSGTGGTITISSGEWDTQINQKMLEILNKGNYKQVIPVAVKKHLPADPGDIIVYFYVFSLIPKELRTYTGNDSLIKDTVKSFINEKKATDGQSINNWTNYFGTVTGKEPGEVFPDLFADPLTIIFPLTVKNSNNNAPITSGNFATIQQALEAYTFGGDIGSTYSALQINSEDADSAVLFSLPSVAFNTYPINPINMDFLGYPLMIAVRSNQSSYEPGANPLGMDNINYEVYPVNNPTDISDFVEVSIEDYRKFQACVIISLMYLQVKSRPDLSLDTRIKETIENPNYSNPLFPRSDVVFSYDMDNNFVSVTVVALDRTFRIHYPNPML
jgi:hypothetical protein